MRARETAAILAVLALILFALGSCLPIEGLDFQRGDDAPTAVTPQAEPVKVPCLGEDLAIGPSGAAYVASAGYGSGLSGFIAYGPDGTKLGEASSASGFRHLFVSASEGADLVTTFRASDDAEYDTLVRRYRQDGTPVGSELRYDCDFESSAGCASYLATGADSFLTLAENGILARVQVGDAAAPLIAASASLRADPLLGDAYEYHSFKAVAEAANGGYVVAADMRPMPSDEQRRSEDFDPMAYSGGLIFVGDDLKVSSVRMAGDLFKDSGALMARAAGGYYLGLPLPDAFIAVDADGALAAKRRYATRIADGVQYDVEFYDTYAMALRPVGGKLRLAHITRNPEDLSPSGFLLVLEDLDSF
jgi:hypothetical protein